MKWRPVGKLGAAIQHLQAAEPPIRAGIRRHDPFCWGEHVGLVVSNQTTAALHESPGMGNNNSSYRWFINQTRTDGAPIAAVSA